MRHKSFTASALLGAMLLAAPAVSLGDDATAPAVVPSAPSAAAPSATTPAPAGVAPSAPSAAAVAPSATTLVPATTPGPATLATAPSARPFTLLGKARVARNGTITLAVQATSTGKFTAFAEIPGTDDDGAASAARAARIVLSDGPMPRPYGNTAKTVAANVPTLLVFRPGKAGRAAIRRITDATPLRVTIAVLFGPRGGSLTTTIYVVKVYAPTAAKAPAKR